MSMEEPDVVLVDEEGVEHRFYLYQVVEVDEKSYALLQPEDREDELVVLRLEGDETSRTLVSIDDEEWERVAAALDGMEFEDDDE